MRLITNPAITLSMPLLTVLLTGCATAPDMGVTDTEVSDLVGTTWTLREVATGGRDIPVHGLGELVFASDGTLHGNAGCHGFDASYTAVPGGSSTVSVTLTALDIAHTNCEALYGEQETAVFDALGQGFEARVIGDTMLVERGGASSSLAFLEERDEGAGGTLTPPR